MVTVGSATLDIFMKSDNFKVMKSETVAGGVAMCEVYGGKMEVEEVEIESGGGATNCAVSLARKELKTACISEIGNDPQALIIHRDLEEAEVETRFLVQEADETTAVSVILIAKDGGRSVMVHRGASAMLTRGDLPLKDLETRWLHISSLGGNLELLTQLLTWAKEKKIRVSLNPGMKEIKMRQRLLKLLPMVEVLFVNREEAEKLWEVELSSEKGWRGGKCLGGAKVSVITDGKRGGKIWMGDKSSFYKGKNLKSVVDSTGAGDAFASGYVAALLYGHNYERAINWGVENASAVIKKVGAKKGLLTLAQIKDY